MKTSPTRAIEVPQGDTRESTYLTANQRQESAAWRLWYRLTSPREPKSEASYQEIEQFRRGRTGSQIILALYLLLVISLPAQFVGTNEYLLYIVGGTALLLMVATGINRMGKVNLAGAIIVFTFFLFPVVNIVTTPDGLSILVLPLYGLLVLPLLCTVSFLPPGWVFVVVLANILFTWLSLSFLPRTAELNALLNIALVGTMTPIILSQIIVSVVAYAWVKSSTRALLRADRAEELAKLEHDMALQAEEAAQEKQKLEISIHHIVETHTRVANGDFTARVPVEGNVLWQIAGPLNNLIKRADGWRKEVLRLQQENNDPRHPNGLIERQGGNRG